MVALDRVLQGPVLVAFAEVDRDRKIETLTVSLGCIPLLQSHQWNNKQLLHAATSITAEVDSCSC